MAGNKDGHGRGRGVAGGPTLGETRCYWALMDSAMAFRYLDPVLQEQMQEVRSHLFLDPAPTRSSIGSDQRRRPEGAGRRQPCNRRLGGGAV